MSGDRHDAALKDGAIDEAAFNLPLALCVGRDGDGGSVVFVADTLNYRIRSIDINRKRVKTVCGSSLRTAQNNWGSEPKFAYPTALDLDAHGDLYVCDMKAHAVRRVTPTSASGLFFLASCFRCM